jgi:hypothetical protein
MSVRPMTSKSILSNKIDNMKTNILCHRIQSSSTTRPSSVNTNRLVRNQQDNSRPVSSSRSVYINNSLISSGLNINTRADIPIEDKDILENLKGTLIRTVYTNGVGKCIMDGLPHDTYLIEIENSKNFIGNGLIFKTNFIIDSVTKNLKDNSVNNKLGTTNKLIGLKRQTDAYVSIYTSFIKDAENFDFTPLKNCNIILRRIDDEKKDSYIEEGN